MSALSALSTAEFAHAIQALPSYRRHALRAIGCVVLAAGAVRGVADAFRTDVPVPAIEGDLEGFHLALSQRAAAGPRHVICGSAEVAVLRPLIGAARPDWLAGSVEAQAEPGLASADRIVGERLVHAQPRRPQP